MIHSDAGLGRGRVSPTREDHSGRFETLGGRSGATPPTPPFGPRWAARCGGGGGGGGASKSGAGRLVGGQSSLIGRRGNLRSALETESFFQFRSFSFFFRTLNQNPHPVATGFSILQLQYCFSKSLWVNSGNRFLLPV